MLLCRLSAAERTILADEHEGAMREKTTLNYNYNQNKFYVSAFASVSTFSDCVVGGCRGAANLGLEGNLLMATSSFKPSTFPVGTLHLYIALRPCSGFASMAMRARSARRGLLRRT